MDTLTNKDGARRWRPSIAMLALAAATVLFCMYSLSESDRKKEELAQTIKARCAKEVPAVSDVCVRAASHTTTSALPASPESASPATGAPAATQ
ncbi:hypothetical protein LMG32289_05401 [Cupriavidus pampae]|uniref:Uncharacterized protein n=1 Tax=Cupriavidus pampae TaxID=659251 RepID=A0ABN7ZHG6_9BURK|nr:hypothetical protein LMG32289_05401 [Cupriavidus pampae]